LYLKGKPSDAVASNYIVWKKIHITFSIVKMKVKVLYKVFWHAG